MAQDHERALRLMDILSFRCQFMNVPITIKSCIKMQLHFTATIRTAKRFFLIKLVTTDFWNTTALGSSDRARVTLLLIRQVEYLIPLRHTIRDILNRADRLVVNSTKSQQQALLVNPFTLCSFVFNVRSNPAQFISRASTGKV